MEVLIKGISTKRISTYPIRKWFTLLCRKLLLKKWATIDLDLSKFKNEIQLLIIIKLMKERL